MRDCLILLTLTSLWGGALCAQDDAPDRTAQLKDSVREWIETMREIQQAEDSWERDRILLEDQRAALQSEIADLEERVEQARVEREGAAKDGLDDEARRDAYIEAKAQLATEIRTLETGLVKQLKFFPEPLAAEPRVKELMAQVEKDVGLSGDAAESGLTKRLNNVLNLLTEAEKWQQTVHLRDELHESADGRKYNMKVVYFGLATAYAVNESRDFALVATPTAEGWTFSERNDLAADIGLLVDVLNGDTDAQFVELPIDLK